LSGKQKIFEYIDHPADIMLRVYGETLSSLFINAAKGLYDVLKPRTKSGGSENRKTGVLKSSSKEELLVLFLNEILFLAIKDHLIFTDFLINIKCSRNQNRLKYNMTGKEIEMLEREVKAVTYHRLKIEKIGKFFQTEIIVDI